MRLPPPFRLRAASLVALIAVAALVAVACDGNGEATPTTTGTPPAATATPETLTKVTFMAGFKPQANLPFVGAYVAKEKGFFEEEGLDVDIQHAQEQEHLQLLMAGRVDFTTADAASVLKRIADPGLDIVSIALIGQKGEQAFATLADSGIESPLDWEGRTFGYKGSVPPEFLGILKAVGLSPDRVKQVRVGYDPRILTEGQVDILAVFVSNEPDTLRSLGFDVRLFDPNDFGIPALGLTYITTREMVEEEPETVERFLKAVLHGIEYAMDNREEAIDIVLKYAPQEEREHQRFMMDTEMGRAVTDLTEENGLGWQTLDQWSALHDTLVEFDAIAQPIDVSQAFTNEFIERIYDHGELVWP
jgi:ABC-type nitrate/sulfonate/bicarbonate transport system substrate-binding protein